MKLRVKSFLGRPAGLKGAEKEALDTVCSQGPSCSGNRSLTLSQIQGFNSKIETARTLTIAIILKMENQQNLVKDREQSRGCRGCSAGTPQCYQSPPLLSSLT